MQARAPAAAVAHVRVAAPEGLATTALAALAARGIQATAGHSVNESFAGDVVGWVLEEPPSPATALELARICRDASAAQRPVCVLARATTGNSRQAIEQTAALAYLRASGAALVDDVDAWLEAIVVLVRFGLPRGPRIAIVAPTGSWLAHQAAGVIANETHGGRVALARGDEPTDVVLYDHQLAAPEHPHCLSIAVAARGELAPGRPALHGARAAVAAIESLGAAALRIAADLGPAPLTADAELQLDHDRIARQLARLPSDQLRVGDHETKVLLAAYGVPITRQAVATTPSAAVKLARRAGYPVEIKPWGHDVVAEPACPVERAITSDAGVRQAFAAVLAAVGKHNDPSAAAIVRETPPSGREITVSLIELPALGWTVVLEAPGVPLAAAPAPLRLIDAEALAARVVASRAGDPELDRVGLANVLRRASHLVTAIERIARLELTRVVVGGRGERSLVVDAYAELRGP